MVWEDKGGGGTGVPEERLGTEQVEKGGKVQAG